MYEPAEAPNSPEGAGELWYIQHWVPLDGTGTTTSAPYMLSHGSLGLTGIEPGCREEVASVGLTVPDVGPNAADRIELADWTLAAAPDDETLSLNIAVGHEHCSPYLGADVLEEQDRVTIYAYMGEMLMRPGYGCPDVGRTEHIEVQLDEPLGSRELAGCGEAFKRRGMRGPPPVCRDLAPR